MKHKDDSLKLAHTFCLSTQHTFNCKNKFLPTVPCYLRDVKYAFSYSPVERTGVFSGKNAQEL